MLGAGQDMATEEGDTGPVAADEALVRRRCRIQPGGEHLASELSLPGHAHGSLLDIPP